MPNWCYNSATLHHDNKEVIDGFETELQKEKAEPFNYLRPNPAGEWDYAWSCENWGCKWDATDVDVDTCDYFNNLFGVTYHFESPWSPPEGFFTKLAEEYPDVDMNMEFREEQGWGGELQSTGDGQVSLIREWDIPASHQDWIDSGDEDGCVCSWGDGSHYDDCPEDNWKEKESE